MTVVGQIELSAFMYIDLIHIQDPIRAKQSLPHCAALNIGPLGECPMRIGYDH